MISAVTSSPRCAGRQRMNIAPVRARVIAAPFTWNGAKLRRELPSHFRIVHREPNIGVGGVSPHRVCMRIGGDRDASGRRSGYG